MAHGFSGEPNPKVPKIDMNQNVVNGVNGINVTANGTSQDAGFDEYDDFDMKDDELLSQIQDPSMIETVENNKYNGNDVIMKSQNSQITNDIIDAFNGKIDILQRNNRKKDLELENVKNNFKRLRTEYEEKEKEMLMNEQSLVNTVNEHKREYHELLNQNEQLRLQIKSMKGSNPLSHVKYTTVHDIKSQRIIEAVRCKQRQQLFYSAERNTMSDVTVNGNNEKHLIDDNGRDTNFEMSQVPCTPLSQIPDDDVQRKEQIEAQQLESEGNDLGLVYDGLLDKLPDDDADEVCHYTNEWLSLSGLWDVKQTLRALITHVKGQSDCFAID